MLTIQESLNKSLFPNWREEGLSWTDAISVEAVELFDHLPWKWWKSYAKEVDYDQVRMEAVDIWHFLMSEALQNSETTSEAKFEIASRLLPNISSPKPLSSLQDIKEAARNMVAVAGHRLEGAWKYRTVVFSELCSHISLDLNTLYTTYVGKACLNKLRWANGYGKTYDKHWHFEGELLEDNVCLAKLIDRLDVEDPQFMQKLSESLEEAYRVSKETYAKKEEGTL